MDRNAYWLNIEDENYSFENPPEQQDVVMKNISRGNGLIDQSTEDVHHHPHHHRVPTLESLLPSFEKHSIGWMFSIDSADGQNVWCTLNGVLKNCIKETAATKTEALKPLLDHLDLEISSNVTFLDILRKRVAMLLREKEEITEYEPDLWIKKEPTFKSVVRSGQFSNWIIKKIEKKLQPILVHLIEYICTNHNQDLLMIYPKWIILIWMEMFNDEKITEMKMEDIHSLKTNLSNVDNYIGENKSMIRSQLPFSWTIKLFIDKLLTLPPPQFKCTTESKFYVENAFNSSPFGMLLKVVCPNSDIKNKIFRRYLNDFVQMTYKSRSKNYTKEIVIIKENLKNTIQNSDNEFECNEDDFSRFIKVHEVYKKHNRKYNLFADIVAFFSESVDIFYNVKKKLTDPIILMQSCLSHILDTLSFSKIDALNMNLIKAWVKDVKSASSIVNRLLEQITSENTKDLKCKWIKIKTLALFIDCTNFGSFYHQGIYLTMWMNMNESFNPKNLKSFNVLDNLVHLCDLQKAEECFRKCCKCKMNVGYIHMECGHYYCCECHEVLTYKYRNLCFLCFSTKQDIKDHLKHTSNKSVTEYLSSRTKINSFWMALATEVLLDDGIPPDGEVVLKLLDWAASEPHKRTQFGCGDNTLTIRSFFIHLLLKHQIPNVDSLLEDFMFKLENVNRIDDKQMIAAKLLLLESLEDHYRFLGNKAPESEERSMFVKNLWQNCDLINFSLTKSNPNMKVLYKLAILKYGLKEIADEIYDPYSGEISNNSDLIELLNSTKIIVENNEQAKLFLLKQMIHNYGFQIISKIAAHKILEWILPPSLKHESMKNSLDYFLLCGEKYKIVNEYLLKAFSKENSTQILKNVKGKDSEYYMLLALFQKLKMSTFKEKKDVNMWTNFFFNDSYRKSKKLIKELLKKDIQFVLSKLSSKPECTNIIGLVFHFYVATKVIPVKNSIINLLCMPIRDPDSVKSSFLPSLPEENIEILGLLLKKENLKFYKCPNGHTYTVGECGLPILASTCITCGREIGRTQNRFGDTLLSLSELNIQTGHILGKANKSSKLLEVRQMTPLQASIMRFFLHAALYIGSFDHDFSKGAIHPSIKSKQVQEFFWVHLENDLRMIQVASGQNQDKILITLHLIIHAMHEKTLPEQHLGLHNNRKRTEWENQFIMNYIDEHIGNLNKVDDLFRRILQKSDQSQILKNLFEDDEKYEPLVDNDRLYECPLFWRFSIKQGKNDLLTDLRNASYLPGKYKFDVLRYFIEHSDSLQQIRRLPKILELQKTLCENFDRSLGLLHSETYTASHVLLQLDDVMKKAITLLFEEFIICWNKLRSDISSFAFKQKIVPKLYKNLKLTMNSQIGYFLPSMQGLGLCSVALVHYLADQQNRLLELCRTVTGESATREISLEECSAENLVMFDADNDLHTILLEHRYHLHRDGNLIESQFQYSSLERRIIDRFIRDKPLINPKMTLFNYMDDLKSIRQALVRLEAKIKQVSSLPEKLNHDFQNLNDVSDVLQCFSVLLEYVVVMDCHPEDKIEKFLETNLQIENAFHGYRPMKKLSLKHIKQAWLSLSQIQAEYQLAIKQPVLICVAPKYKQLIENYVWEEVRRLLSGSIDLNLFASILFECIVLEITTSTEDEETNNANQKLFDILYAFAESKNMEGQFTLMKDRFPDRILAQHCIDLWTRCLRFKLYPIIEEPYPIEIYEPE